MPVTIGEFEVVDAPSTTPPAAAAAAASPPPALDALGLQRLQQQLQEEALRTWAH